MLHSGVKCNKVCTYNLGKRSFIAVNMTREDNTEIDLWLIIFRLLAWFNGLRIVSIS
jgi:hypothetical protein